MLAAAGTRLRLIAVTDGEASHPAADPEVIARVRTEESAAARDVLGARDADVVRLRLPDTGLAAREDELADRLGACAGFVVCLAPWEADAHADHEAAGGRHGGPPGGDAELPDLDVALGQARGPPGPLAAGLPGSAHRGRRGEEESGDRCVRQPVDRPRGRRGPGASAGNRGALHPAAEVLLR